MRRAILVGGLLSLSLVGASAAWHRPRAEESALTYESEKITSIETFRLRNLERDLADTKSELRAAIYKVQENQESNRTLLLVNLAAIITSMATWLLLRKKGPNHG